MLNASLKESNLIFFNTENFYKYLNVKKTNPPKKNEKIDINNKDKNYVDMIYNLMILLLIFLIIEAIVYWYQKKIKN